MISLDDFWKFISYRPGLHAAAGEWRACLGDDLWTLLRGQLFVGDGIAKTYRRVTDDRSLQVVSSAGGYGLVCETTGNVEASHVPEEDVRQFRLDPPALRNMVAAALGIACDPGRVGEMPRAFPLGTWMPMDGVDVPAFLMLPPTSKLLASEIHRLLLEITGGFILLVPQPPRLDARIREQLKRRQAAVIPLPDVVVWSGTNFCAAPGWDTYRNSYCARHLSDRMVPAEPEYRFAKKGMWTIRFAGKETFLEGTLKGPVFIRYLLIHQGEEIHVARMLADIAGDERLAQASNSGDAITPEEIAYYRERYAELQASKEEATEWNDEGRLAVIEKGLGQMAAHLGPLFGLGGRSRKANDDVARIRKAVARVIGIALDKIAESDPALEQHLRKSIKTHSYMSYEPETRIDWNFE